MTVQTKQTTEYMRELLLEGLSYVLRRIIENLHFFHDIRIMLLHMWSLKAKRVSHYLIVLFTYLVWKFTMRGRVERNPASRKESTFHVGLGTSRPKPNFEGTRPDSGLKETGQVGVGTTNFNTGTELTCPRVFFSLFFFSSLDRSKRCWIMATSMQAF